MNDFALSRSMNIHFVSSVKGIIENPNDLDITQLKQNKSKTEIKKQKQTKR